LINYVTNFKELQFFTENISAQFSVAKWNRWLYKYSILHRKILKNSHKLTVIKRLLNSGFYKLMSTNNDLWSITKVNKLPVQNSLFSNQIINLSNNTATNQDWISSKITILNTNNVSTKIANLNNYENSFFYFIKRFFFFNTLSTNNIYSKKTIPSPLLKNLSSLDYSEQYWTSHSILLNYLLKNHLHWLLQHDLFTSPFTESINYDDQIKYIPKIKTMRDYFLFNNELDLLSPANLNVFYWTSTPLKTLYNFNFYNYLTLIKNNHLNTETEFFDSENDTSDLSYLIYAEIQIEDFLIKNFINDFIVLSDVLSKIYKN
jgi:hypothetical protein